MDRTLQALVISSEVALTADLSGRWVAFSFANPSAVFRLSNNAVALLQRFSHREPRNTRQVVNAQYGDEYCSEETLRAICESVDQLTKAGLLCTPSRSFEHYSAEMKSAYERSRVLPGPVLHAIAELAQVQAGKRVLDVGSGPGHLPVYLAERSAQVSVLDISPAFLELTRQRAQQANVPVECIHGSANKLAFSKRKFDIITMCQSFVWLNPYCAVQGITQSLEDGGSCIIAESKALIRSDNPLHHRMSYGYATGDDLRRELLSHVQYYRNLVAQPRWGTPKLVIDRVKVLSSKQLFDRDFATAYFFDRDSMCIDDSMFNEINIVGSMYWLLIRIRRRSRPRGQHPLN